MARVAPGELTQPTVAATFQRIGQELDTLQKDRATFNAQTIDLNKQILALRAEYQGMVDAHTKAQKKAEADRQDAQTIEGRVGHQQGESPRRSAEGRSRTCRPRISRSNRTRCKQNDASRLANRQSRNDQPACGPRKTPARSGASRCPAARSNGSISIPDACGSTAACATTSAKGRRSAFTSRSMKESPAA